MAGLRSLDAEEDLAVGRSSRADSKFDTTVGHLEDIIMEDNFQTTQHDFKEKYYHHFTDEEENKLIYMDIFKEYVDLIENYIQEELRRRIPGFSMEDFTKTLQNRQDQIGEDILDILLSFTDFMVFKQMFVEYKALKEGTGVDLSGLLTVTSTSSCHEEHQEMQIDPQSSRGKSSSPSDMQ